MILVTGAGGFIGGEIARHLARNKYEVISAGRSKSLAGASGAVTFDPPMESAHSIELDLSHPETLVQLAKFKIKTVVHCAGYVPQPGDTARGGVCERLMLSNVCGTANLMRAVSDLESVELVVLMSSAGVYDPGVIKYYAADSVTASTAGKGIEALLPETAPTAPSDMYGLSKLAAEHAAFIEFRRAGRYNLTVLRPSYVYGPGQTKSFVISRWVELARAGEDIVVDLDMPAGTGISSSAASYRDYIYIDDLSDAVAKIVAAKHSDVYNVGSGRAVSLPEAARIIANQFGLPSDKIVYRRKGIYLSPAEAEDALNTAKGEAAYKFMLDISKISTATGYKPKYADFEKGIARYKDRAKH